MARSIRSLLLLTASLAALSAASCSSQKKPAPTTEPVGATTTVMGADGGMRTTYIEPGVAGGIIEETDTVSAKVTAVDQATRKVTLQGEDGDSATFTAGPDVKNLAQVHVGDTLTATLKQKLIVYVRSGREDASATYTAAVAAAPKGAKPGAIAGESYEVVASVAAIDPEKRTATLKFADGKTRTVQVRPDVDPSRYKVGDTVVIRVTTTLALLVAKP